LIYYLEHDDENERYRLCRRAQAGDDKQDPDNDEVVCDFYHKGEAELLAPHIAALLQETGV